MCYIVKGTKFLYKGNAEGIQNMFYISNWDWYIFCDA